MYLERAELYFTANAVEENSRVPIFLSMVGARTYQLLRDLLAPPKPQDKSLADLYSCLFEHYEPTPITIAERFVFTSGVKTAGNGYRVHGRAKKVDYSLQLR